MSHFIPEPRNFAEVTKLSENIRKPWLKATIKEIKNLINNQTFMIEAQTANKKYAIHKRLSEQSKKKAGTLMQKVKDLRDKLEGTQDKANDEVDNLNYLLNVDAENKETLENRV